MSMREAGAGTRGFKYNYEKEAEKRNAAETRRRNAEAAERNAQRIRNLENRPAPAAPAPQPEPKKAEPVGTSDTLQNANGFLSNYKKSGFNFKNTTQDERKEVTDSFDQKPAYDPNAGVSSPEAGNFLDDFKLNLKDQVNKVRTKTTNNLNPNPNGGE